MLWSNWPTATRSLSRAATPGLETAIADHGPQVSVDSRADATPGCSYQLVERLLGVEVLVVDFDDFLRTVLSFHTLNHLITEMQFKFFAREPFTFFVFL